MFKTLLCPTDFRDASYEAIRTASMLAEAFQAELILLPVLVVHGPKSARSDARAAAHGEP